MNKKILIILAIIIIPTVIFFGLRQKNPEIPTDILAKQDLIKVTHPSPYELIKSPLTIEGRARGYWFFEASFPVKLLDENGNELGLGISQALSDWMVEDFVPFRTTIEFEAPKTKTGTLILKKDNPSGLPENDDELRIPVRF